MFGESIIPIVLGLATAAVGYLIEANRDGLRERVGKRVGKLELQHALLAAEFYEHTEEAECSSAD